MNNPVSILKTALVAMFITTLPLVSHAEMQHDKCRFSLEQFHAQLEQYITQAACLTPQEASRFFPIYKEMMKKQRELHNEMRNYKRIKPVSEAECKKCVERMDKIDIEIKQIQRRYREKFLQILPAGKVYDIIKAEDKFYRQSFKKIADKKSRH